LRYFDASRAKNSIAGWRLLARIPSTDEIDLHLTDASGKFGENPLVGLRQAHA
jgi:hypothetical protein